MYKTASLFLTFFFLHGVLLNAQKTMVSLSASYGKFDRFHKIHVLDNEYDNSVGLMLGYESKLKKHVSLGIDLNLQIIESVPAIAISLPPESMPYAYVIKRQQFNGRMGGRWYLSEMKGFFAGLFATYSYLTVTTSGYPEGDKYYSAPSSKDPLDDFGGGGGLMYGYRLKLTQHLLISAQANHEHVWYENDYRAWNNQIWLGANWLF